MVNDDGFGREWQLQLESVIQGAHEKDMPFIFNKQSAPVTAVAMRTDT